MATTTPNFGWPVPTSTDLVKNGATAIEALGDAIDASLVDLEGGTTGQVLAKASNTDMDFAWVAQDDSNAIQNTIVDAKGDLIAASAADTPARLAVGTNGQVLTADSTAATGLAWATASGGSTNMAGKNGVLNSQFNVWQRGTSISGAGGGAYSADRWLLYAGGQATVSRQATGDTTNLPFIQYCARVQRNNASTDVSTIPLTQSFETVNSIQYAGKTVTFSYYARRGANYSSTSNLLYSYLYTGTGTDQNISTGYTGQANPIAGTATLTTTWQRFTFSATLATTATELGLSFSYGPTGTAGAADYFEITGVQLEIAGSASAYSPNTSTYALELAACQRYYYRAIGDGSNAYQNLGPQGNASGTGACQFPITLPVIMRKIPSAVDYLGVGITLAGTTTYAITTLSMAEAATTSVLLVGATASTLTQYRPYFLSLSANAAGYFGISAEL
jgi:hypothetical protein